ncbi:MAG: 3-phosphoshikimate 1-carboxyvinyltransferase [Phycisphaerales bacterium]|nr:3-phosphoshikimate 1-carboxyvinyltransferase [Phycisphaerales bacterium]
MNPIEPVAIARCDGHVNVAIRVPGSKSISCRALVLAALADGVSTIQGLLRADDTDALALALTQVGAKTHLDADVATVTGPLISVTDAEVHLGHGGTPARFMLACASIGGGRVVIDGSDRLRERPMGEMAPLLEALGATVEFLGTPQSLPMAVQGGPWKVSQLDMGQMTSSQFLSALLLVGASMPSGLELRLQEAPPSEAYLRLTIAELRAWGVDVEVEERDHHLTRVHVAGGGMPSQSRSIPADASSALFWAAAASLMPGSRVHLECLDLKDDQPDAAAFSVLAAMGLTLEMADDGLWCLGPDQLRAVGTVDCSAMPDAVPALAAAACFADGPTRLTGLSTLRVKESDRIATVAGEWGRAGADIQIEGDDLIIRPQPLPDHPVTLQTWQDHRIAMGGAILGLRRGGVSIADPGCTAKSYPGFWADLARFAADAPSGDNA